MSITSVNEDDDSNERELARRAKDYAHDQGRTFTDVVTDAVKEFITRPGKLAKRKRIILPTSGNAKRRKFTEADYRARVERMYEQEAERINEGNVVQVMLLDVNILVYAFRDDADQHPPMAAFLNDLVNGTSMFGVPETCMSSLVRTVTQKAFRPPSHIGVGLPLLRCAFARRRHFCRFSPAIGIGRYLRKCVRPQRRPERWLLTRI